ncbi:hypothetical protein GA830_15315 [Mesorhizobium sp. NBSH29]|uniref:hypothetical protein n=1 Tax=Mesorhizobium sp. NBSH29 TaxID=2654249 RepID=UPI0018966433|nr:hypothetical protein [Mesorhizobium sp. NBSH29]QPC87967.1 hypothetical protein GA830_15315 [Mesorhizobium sp. NBSH29]
MTNLRTFLGALILLQGLSACAVAPTISEKEAATLVDRFCTTLISGVAHYDPNGNGAWPPNDPKVFGPLLTTELTSFIGEADALNAAFEASTKEKGPLGDGVPWKAYQDEASTCTPGVISGSAEKAEVEITYSFELAPDTGWTDALVLVRHEGAWRIDDIRFEKPIYGSGLRTVLSGVLDQLK